MVGGIENKGETMPRTRKSHPPSLKAKVAIEAIKAHKTTTQIVQMFGVHPTQVGGWKKQALAGLPDIFGNGLGWPLDSRERAVMTRRFIEEWERPEIAAAKPSRSGQFTGESPTRRRSWRRLWPPFRARPLNSAVTENGNVETRIA
jgi:transposase-like protein